MAIAAVNRSTCFIGRIRNESELGVGEMRAPFGRVRAGWQFLGRGPSVFRSANPKHDEVYDAL